MNPRNTHKLVLMALLIGASGTTTTSYGGLVIGDIPLKSNPQVIVGVPDSSGEAIVISRKQYVVSWNPDTRTPEWVSWVINKRALGDSPRSDVFRLDRDLDEVLAEQNLESVLPKDYKSSCLDRGHQVPSGDRTASVLDNEATFLMSNIMPQSAHLNRRTWVSLERFLRRRVLEHGQHVQVYTGAISQVKGRGIGPNGDIEVPRKNFKIAVLMPASRSVPARADMQFFVANFPNLTSVGTDPVDDHKQACYDSDHTVRLEEENRQALWRPFLSSLAQVEYESGFDFSFLRGIHEMTRSEIDEMLGADFFAVQPVFPTLPSMIQGALK